MSQPHKKPSFGGAPRPVRPPHCWWWQIGDNKSHKQFIVPCFSSLWVVCPFTFEGRDTTRAANDPSVFTITEKAPTTHTRTFSWLKALSYLRHAKVILSLKGCNCENRWIVCSSRHDRLEAGCGDPYKVETHHALVYRSIVSGPPALLQLGYLHSIHYWARASNCFGLFAGSIATVGTHAYCRELELHRVSAEAATCPAWLHARHLLSCHLKPAVHKHKHYTHTQSDKTENTDT